MVLRGGREMCMLFMLITCITQFFGTSSELSVGPVAMVSLLIPEAAGSIAGFFPSFWMKTEMILMLIQYIAQGTQEYAEAAILLAAIVGVMMAAASLLRVGFLIENLLSHPVQSLNFIHFFVVPFVFKAS